MSERHHLALVTLYDRVFNGPGDTAAKNRYLEWLKGALLILAEDDPLVSEDSIEDMRDDIKHHTFSEVATFLGYRGLIKAKLTNCITWLI